MSQTLANAAKEYIEGYGFHLFPLKEQSKKPATAHGLHDATNKLVIAQGWWTKDSKLNIGLRTGEISGVWVLDVDGKNGEYDLSGLEFDHGDLPKTPCQKTSNGRHYFFKYPSGLDIKNRAQIIKHDEKGGLDVRGNGGYVVIAPSIHPDTGMPYEWVLSPQECPFADAPQWLLDLVIKAPEAKFEATERQPFSFAGAGAIAHKSTSPESIINDQIKMVASTNEGGRNHALNIAAMKVGRVIGSGAVDDGIAQNAINQLAGAAKAIGLGEDEIMPTINSGLKYGITQPYGYGGQNKPVNMANSENSKANSLNQNTNKIAVMGIPVLEKPNSEIENPLTHRLFTLEQIMNMPPVQWMVDKIFPINSFGIIYGAPGQKKTFLALDIALSLAYNQEWHERSVDAGSVLYIAGEGVGGLGKRVSAWINHYQANKEDIDFTALASSVNFMNEVCVQQLISLIDGTGKKFKAIFIDTVARSILGGDENSSTDIGLFVAACEAVKNHTGAAVIGIHHSGKDEDRGMRGSNALLGAVDTVLKVQHDKDTKIVTVTMERQKDDDMIEPLFFNSKVVEFGIGQSSVVLEMITENVPLKVIKKDKKFTYDLALEYLQDCIAKSSDISYGQPATQLNQWKLECYSREFGGDSQEAKRKSFERAFKRLTETKQIACKNSLVWIIKD